MTNRDNKIDVSDKIDAMYEAVEKNGIDFLYSAFFTTCERFLDLPRKQEVHALINRMRRVHFAKAGDAE